MRFFIFAKGSRGLYIIQRPIFSEICPVCGRVNALANSSQGESSRLLNRQNRLFSSYCSLTNAVELMSLFRNVPEYRWGGHECHDFLYSELSLKIGVYRNRCLRKSCDFCVTSLSVFDVPDSLKLVMSSELLSIAYIEHPSVPTYNPV